MGLVGVQVSVVETTEKEMQKTVVGTFLVGQAEKYDCVLSKAQARFYLNQRASLFRDAI